MTAQARIRHRDQRAALLTLLEDMRDEGGLDRWTGRLAEAIDDDTTAAEYAAAHGICEECGEEHPSREELEDAFVERNLP